jgi:hypothetical protein
MINDNLGDDTPPKSRTLEETVGDNIHPMQLYPYPICEPGFPRIVEGIKQMIRYAIEGVFDYCHPKPGTRVTKNPREIIRAYEERDKLVVPDLPKIIIEEYKIIPK